MAELARLLDPTELDALEGPHGKMTLSVASARLGDAIVVVVPARLGCARCDGGGCDACGRSGAIRLELDEAARTTQIVLPTGARERLRVRLRRPLGDEAGLEQLTIDVQVTPPTSTALVASQPGPLALRGEPTATRSILVAAALAIAALLAIAASLR